MQDFAHIGKCRIELLAEMTTDLDCPHIMESYSAGVAWHITYVAEPSEWTWRFAASVLALTVKEYYKCGETAFGRQRFLYISLGTWCEDTPLAESTLGPFDYTCEYPDYRITLVSNPVKSNEWPDIVLAIIWAVWQCNKSMTAKM